MPRISVYFVSLFFLLGSIGHFVFVDFLVMSMPTYLPLHRELVYLTGVFELLGAIGILIPYTRVYSAYSLIALCVAVFPANIHMAINAHLYSEIPAAFLYLRLPLQAVLIGYIWWAVSPVKFSRRKDVVVPRISVYFVSLFFLLGSIGHFVFVDFLVMSMPTYLPLHRELVYLTGVFELLGAIGILIPYTRVYSAYSLIALCVAVFPANIHMAINAHLYSEIPAAFLYLRLPLQAVLIGYIWWAVSPVKKNPVVTEQVQLQVHSDSKLESVCKEFIGNLNNLLKWKWDDRFQTALAEFGIDNEENVHGILEKYFKNIWDSSNIGSAPDNIRAVINEMGGLKAGQLLFTSEAIEDTFIYCVLWPWGNQKTISIRISPSFQFANEEEKMKQVQEVKSWFGIKPEGSGWIKINDDALAAG